MTCLWFTPKKGIRVMNGPLSALLFGIFSIHTFSVRITGEQRKPHDSSPVKVNVIIVVECCESFLTRSQILRIPYTREIFNFDYIILLIFPKILRIENGYM